MQTHARTIIWNRLDMPGHESAKLFLVKSCWTFRGTAVFVHERKACRLDYSLKCASDWQTLGARITGWVGDQVVGVQISVDSDHHWRLNKWTYPKVTGCVDLDLNFSPLTNTLPIRRLNLAVGHEARVRAAWLRFPSFELEPLEQVYRRVKPSKYRYESARDGFITELEVDTAGLVTDYPNFWRIENAQ